MWSQRTVASHLLLTVLGVLMGAVLLGGVLDLQVTRRSLDRQYEERARSIAAVVAGTSDIRAAVQHGDPGHVIQPLAERFAHGAGATYVVVTDRTGLRYSHPNPALIGRRLEEPVAVLDGHDHVGIDDGSLGRSANGKAPVLGTGGAVIGQVSVGILETRVESETARQAWEIVIYSTLVLGVGVMVSVLLARAVKRSTFGLELREIAALLQEREAMLHGIREGVLGVDQRGRITVVNDEARRLLGIRGAGLGRTVPEVIAPGRLRDLLTGDNNPPDQSVLTNDALLVVNRRPVTIAGRDVGSIVTLRDRTEQEALLRRMQAITGLSDALRAQQHEFTNRLHALVGLLDLGEDDEARRYLDLIMTDNVAAAEDLRSRIAPAPVAALLLAKMAVAAERNVDLSVPEDAHLDAPELNLILLMTVIGNLVDNAIEATAGQPGPRRVTVHLSQDATEASLLVIDTGPGVPAEATDKVLEDGYSTKPARGADGQLRRGIGLALVDRMVTRVGGRVIVAPGPGGRFEVRLPLAPVPEILSEIEAESPIATPAELPAQPRVPHTHESATPVGMAP